MIDSDLHAAVYAILYTILSIFAELVGGGVVVTLRVFLTAEL